MVPPHPGQMTSNMLLGIRSSSFVPFPYPAEARSNSQTFG